MLKSWLLLAIICLLNVSANPFFYYFSYPINPVQYQPILVPPSAAPNYYYYLPGQQFRQPFENILHNVQRVAAPLQAPRLPISRSDDNNIEIFPTLDTSLLVQTKSGAVKGVHLNDGVNAWLGIPFAEPPLGPLRFSPPLPVKPWSYIFDANKVEIFGNFSGTEVLNANTPVSEDCLYLNVYAPKKVTQKLPVLVYIYGGGFTTGSNTLDIYEPSALVTRGNIIYVAMQYRLGAFGFLNLGENSTASGNVGLLDQNLALQWIKTNIEAFGGDPDQVTLMGQSAGGVSVALHLLSPMSKDLFHRVIIQSAGASPIWGYQAPLDSIKRAEKLTLALDCKVNPEDPEIGLECLRALPASRILETQPIVVDFPNIFPFLPTTDGKFLTRLPQDAILAGDFKDVPVLIGTNENEGNWALLIVLPDFYPNAELSLAKRSLPQAIYKAIVGKLTESYPEELATLISTQYEDTFNGADKYFRSIEKVVDDSEFVCNAEFMAQASAKKGNNVFRYNYNHRSSTSPWPSWTGSMHGDEIEFVFGHPLKRPEGPIQ